MKDQIVEKYQNQETIASIMRTFNMTHKQIRRILEKENVYRKYNSKAIYNENITSFIKDNYYKLEAQTICEILKISDSVLYSVLSYLKIPLRGSGNVLRDITKEIDYNSVEFFYLYGWIISDGHVSKGDRGDYIVSISTKDKEIVELFLKYFPFLKVHVKKGTEQNHIYVSSKKLHKYFIDKGFESKKANNIYIKDIPINNHLIRGIFDGDGSVRDISKRRSFDAKITTGSLKLVEQLKEYLEKEEIIVKVYPNGKCYNVTIQGKENLLKFYKLLYKNCSDLFLKRKKNLFVAMFGDEY